MLPSPALFHLCFMLVISTSRSQWVPQCVRDPNFDGVESPPSRPSGPTVQPVIAVRSESTPDTNNKCPTITFHLPWDDQTTDYIRYRSYVPRMPQATVCSWIETNDFDDDVNTILSYATTNYMNNALLLGVDTRTRIRTHIMGPMYVLNTPALQTKFHICHWFSSSSRRSGIYINGKSVGSWQYGGRVVDGGGDMVFGQEQDNVNAGRLEAIQAFQGNITNFLIWPRVLTEREIFEIVYKCECPKDYTIKLSLDRVELFGQAYYSFPSVCPTLK